MKSFAVVCALLFAVPASAQWTCSGPGQAIQWDGTGLVCATIAPNPSPTPTPSPLPALPQPYIYQTVPVDVFSTDSAAWADVTGLSFAVEPHTRYVIDCRLVTQTTATTTAVHLSLNGPPAPALLLYTVGVNNSALAWHTSVQTAWDSVTNATSSSTVATQAAIYGTVETGDVGGQLAVRLKSEVAGSAVSVRYGSYCDLVKVADVAEVMPPAGLALAAIGDSKTLGPGLSTGYRRELAYSLGTAYVGSYAVGGLTVAVLRNGIDAWLAGIVQAADYVLLNIGANDLPTMPSTYQANLEYVADAIHAAWPSARVLIARPWRRDQDVNADAMAAIIEGIVSARSPWAALGPDERGFLRWTDDGVSRTVEGVHPNTWGYHLTADEWRSAMGF